MPKRSPEMPLTLARSAFTLFPREGIRQVNVEKIARQAGVTKGSLYWHFRSKQELIEAAAAYYYQTCHRRLHSETARCPEPLARLKRATQLSADLCLFDRENRVFTLETLSLSLYDETLRRGWLQFYDSVTEPAPRQPCALRPPKKSRGPLMTTGPFTQDDENIQRPPHPSWRTPSPPDRGERAGVRRAF
jgi:AcrR family transcriptional regulator